MLPKVGTNSFPNTLEHLLNRWIIVLLNTSFIWAYFPFRGLENMDEYKLQCSVLKI